MANNSQRRSESAQAAAAFEQYAAMNPDDRSLRKLAAQRIAQMSGKAEAIPSLKAEEARLFGWSSDHAWVERVKEYDRQHYRALRTMERKQEIASLRRLRRNLFTALEKDTARLLRIVEEAPDDATVIVNNMQDVQKALDSINELAGVSLGSIADMDEDEPTSTSGNPAAVAADGLRRSVERLLRRAGE